MKQPHTALFVAPTGVGKTHLAMSLLEYFLLLKMAEELIGNLDYESRQSDTKHQKLLECALTGNSKLYLGKLYTVYRKLRPRKLRPRKLRPRKLRPRKLRPRKLRPRKLRPPNNFQRKALFSSFSRQSISVASAECLKSVKNLKNEEFQKVEN